MKYTSNQVLEGIKNGSIGLIIRNNDEYEKLCAAFENDLTYENGKELREATFSFDGYSTGLKGLSCPPYNICILTDAQGRVGYSMVTSGVGKAALKNRIKKYLHRDATIIELADIVDLREGATNGNQ